jgi:hypothetical protein
MRTRLMIATSTTAALLAGAALAQSSGVNGSNFSQNRNDTAVNPPAASNQLPPSTATGNAAVNPPTPSGQAGTSDSTAPAATAPIQGPSGATTRGSLGSSESATVAPAAGAPTERTSSANAGVDVVSNGPIPDTPQNRAKYGQPLSHAGRMTKAQGN